MRDIGFFVAISGFLFGILVISAASTSWSTAVPYIGFALLLAVIFGIIRALTSATIHLPIVVSKGMSTLACVAALALAIGMLRASFVSYTLPLEFEPLLGRETTVEGVLVVQPDQREAGVRLTVEIKQEKERTRILAVTPLNKRFFVGDRLRVTGMLERPEPFATNGGRTFRYDAFLAKGGVFGSMQRADVVVVGRERGFALMLRRVLQGARDGFMRSLNRALPEPESALASGLITGGKQGLGKELVTVFTTVGLVHIVVLSGYNVMIVAESILRLFVALPRRLAFSLAAFVIALFVLAAGAGAAAARAGLMALLALLARATGRTYAVVRALLLTLAVMVAWSPLALLHDPGLKLSFTATLGLILGAPLLIPRLQWIPWEGLREIVATTLAAQIAVLPLLLYQTGNLSPFALLANVLVLPFIPLAMALGTAAALVTMATASLTELPAIVAGLPAYAVLAYVIAVAEAVADLPYARTIIPPFPFWVVVGAYGALALLVRIVQKRTAPSLTV